MAVKYKHKCTKCNQNYVTVTSRQRFIICYDCQKKELEGEITDPAMKKLFTIPEKYYEENTFLRSIKISYLRFEKLSEKQIEMFAKVVQKMNQESK